MGDDGEGGGDPVDDEDVLWLGSWSGPPNPNLRWS
jgi:hypothetical protein